MVGSFLVLVVSAGCTKFEDAPSPNDGGTADGSSPADGNASDVMDGAASGSYCSRLVPQSTFCVDFDTPAANVTAGWDGDLGEANTKVELDGTHAASKPKALHAQSYASGPAKPAGLERSFTFKKRLSIDLDVLFLEVPDGSSSARLGAVLLDSPSDQEIELYVSTATAYFQYGGNVYSPDGPPPTLGEWHHVNLTIALGPPTKFTGSIDGNQLWSDYKSPADWVAPRSVQLRVGMPAPYQIVGSAEAWIDNVVVRVD